MKQRTARNDGNSRSGQGRQTVHPFKLQITRNTTGERVLRIHSLHPNRGEIAISRDHAYYFMEQVIHFVAALNKPDCEST